MKMTKKVEAILAKCKFEKVEEGLYVLENVEECVEVTLVGKDKYYLRVDDCVKIRRRYVDEDALVDALQIYVDLVDDEYED